MSAPVKRGRGRPRKNPEQPIQPMRRGRGRPPKHAMPAKPDVEVLDFVPTKKQRDKVSRYVSCGMTHESIAKVFGISIPTLKKYFEYELATGAAVKRAEIIDMMYDLAPKNPSIQKKLEEITRTTVSAQAIIEREKGAEPERPQKALKLGKKEERQLAAESVSGKFAPPPAPKIVVNNDR